MSGTKTSGLDRDYSPSTKVDDITVYLREYTARTALAHRTLTVHRDLPTGPLPPQLVDYFPPRRPGAPLVVYVHGGYWQELGRADSGFCAIDLVPAGAAVAVLGYGLAPEYRMDEIVAMSRGSLRWLADNRAALPGAPGDIHLVGMSAGAHLVAMALLDGWLPGRRPAELFAGAVLLSGIYDLDPVRRTYVNEPLGMDPAEAARNSPLWRLPDRLPPLVVARGLDEPTGFADQHAAFAAAAGHRGADVIDLVVAGRNHFDLPFDIGDPATPLGAAVLARLGLDTPVDR